MDAIIIADTNEDSFSSTNPLKLQIDGQIANIQIIKNFLQNNGHLELPNNDAGVMSWSSTSKLNGIYLYNYLVKQKFQVELINNYYQESERFISFLRESPRMIIISTTFIHNKKALLKLTRDIRKLAPEIFIIAGGAFVFMSYRMMQRSGSLHYEFDTIKDDFLFIDNNGEPAVDLYIISLRGEQILCEAMQRIKNHQPFDNLPNTAQYVGDKYFFNERKDDVANTKEVPIDWRGLPDTIFKAGAIPLAASSGCPYACSFCNFVKDRRLTATKPVSQLIDELKAVSERGIQYVWFVDDNFRLGAGDLNLICQRLINENIPIHWMSFIRASALRSVDPELLRRSGCIEIQLGIESADPQVLLNMNKKADPAVYTEVIKKLLAVGIHCSCYFIFGFPGETEESIRRTQEFIESIECPDYDGVLSWSMFPFILSPMSPIYEPEMRARYGLEGYMFNWKHKTMDSERARDHVVNTFLKLENSGAIYRGDNLKMLNSLNPRKRKEFMSKRHKLSKSAMQSSLKHDDIKNQFKDLID
jgi:anaerobic magnesium-protoporphyrin IX monomethyl ester cyclase